MSNYSELQNMADRLGYSSVEEFVDDNSFVIEALQSKILHFAKRFPDWRAYCVEEGLTDEWSEEDFT